MQLNGLNGSKKLWKEWEANSFCIYGHLPDTFELGGKMKPGGKDVFIQPSVTLLGAVYQPMLKQKITRKTLGIDVLEELQVHWKHVFHINQQRITFSIHYKIESTIWFYLRFSLQSQCERWHNTNEATLLKWLFLSSLPMKCCIQIQGKKIL